MDGRGTGTNAIRRLSGALALALAALALLLGALSPAAVAAPAITIASPQGASTVSESTPSIKGATDDSSDMVELSLYKGSAVEGAPDLTWSTAPVGLEWETTSTAALQDGLYTVVAQQTDAISGEVGQSVVTFTIDTTPPAVSLTPLSAFVTSPSPLLGGSAGTAAGDRESVAVSIYPGTAASGTPLETVDVTPISGSWSAAPAKGLTDGTYTAIAEQADNAGNVGKSEQSTFIVDTAKPSVSLNAVASLTDDFTPSFAGSTGTALHDEPAVTVDIYAGSAATGPPLKSGSASVSGGTWSYTSTSLADGTYTVQATQRDEAGNVGESVARTFTVDATAPVVTLTPVPALVASAEPELTGTGGGAPGDSESVAVTIYAGTGTSGAKVETLKPMLAAASWSVTPAKPLSDGTYTVIAEQSDSAGNIGKSKASTFRIDTRPPAVTLTTPTNGALEKNERVLFSGKAGTEVGDEPSVTLNIYNAGSSEPLVAVHVKPSGGTWESHGPELPAGEYIVQALQSDTALNTGVSSPHTFTIRTQSPVVTLSTAMFAHREGSKLVTGSSRPDFATEPAAGIKAVEVDVYEGTSPSGTPIKFKMTAQAAGAWAGRPVEPLREVTYTAQAHVEDVAGNEGVSAPVIFTLDEKPPTLTLTAPIDGTATGSETVLVGGRAGTAEGDLPHVGVQVFSGAAGASPQPFEELVVDVSQDGSWSVPVGGLSPGTYNVRAQQEDDVGNRRVTEASTFTVTAPPSSTPAATPTPAPPVASFTWAPANPVVGQTVTLVSTSTSVSSTIGSFAWDLDGSGHLTPGGPAITTSFSTAGAHVVHLQVTDGSGLASSVARTIVVAAPALRLMQPFPIVRFAGTETSYGARLKLLTVQAPIGARVQVTCVGRRCKTKPESRIAAASTKSKGVSGAVTLSFARFERALRAGVTLQVRVTMSGQIGKFTSFAVRRGKLPVRNDQCVLTMISKPFPCPASQP